MFFGVILEMDQRRTAPSWHGGDAARGGEVAELLV